ncbi:hypothetical protein [Hydrogenimonas urashimensis]|uniref:hypothetical protein n=1 Tax=Hydrogenimonas urashimensis TaxID=2740515 RepID=UPI0019151C7E|nr:hypothetical protein [Hydrogenimonas urashimensis]
MKYKIEYSDNLPKEYGGYCYFPLVPVIGTCRIVIRPKYRGDIGLHEHELVHCRQYRRNFLHGLLWAISKKYRLKCEIEAYKEQLKNYGCMTIDCAKWVARALYEKYDFDITYNEALQIVKTALIPH